MRSHFLPLSSPDLALSGFMLKSSPAAIAWVSADCSVWPTAVCSVSMRGEIQHNTHALLPFDPLVNSSSDRRAAASVSIVGPDVVAPFRFASILVVALDTAKQASF